MAPPFPRTLSSPSPSTPRRALSLTCSLPPPAASTRATSLSTATARASLPPCSPTAALSSSSVTLLLARSARPLPRATLRGRPTLPRSSSRNRGSTGRDSMLSGFGLALCFYVSLTLFRGGNSTAEKSCISLTAIEIMSDAGASLAATFAPRVP